MEITIKEALSSEPQKQQDNAIKRSVLGKLLRFELINNDPETIRSLESLLSEKELARKDIALILLNLRVRPGFGPSDFGI